MDPNQLQLVLCWLHHEFGCESEILTKDASRLEFILTQDKLKSVVHKVLFRYLYPSCIRRYSPSLMFSISTTHTLSKPKKRQYKGNFLFYETTEVHRRSTLAQNGPKEYNKLYLSEIIPCSNYLQKIFTCFATAFSVCAAFNCIIYQRKRFLAPEVKTSVKRLFGSLKQRYSLKFASIVAPLIR